ncbi:MAG TPA: GNAT family N-acetyltransferase [Ochrobactrum intermedium]|uniref:GNAT family N-acetyltransferase n=1 Tax=Brucella intermedia TaxID=94625 RepID=A0A7V6U0N8_9HYPH|nr:GNAT family N-acetyltransferase [Brucella intermedia]HHV69165.1 GNAT family N-acetyltransferase [Brucella intermedia]
MVEHRINIRRLEKADWMAFRQVRLEALLREPASFTSTYGDWLALPDNDWCRRLDDPVFAVFRDNEPVGLAGLVRERLSRAAHRASITMVYIRQDFRGCGLAKSLLDRVAKFAWDIGVTQLELTVSAENPVAISFYRREGFVEIGRIPAGFIHEGREIDDVLMVRRLAIEPPEMPLHPS